MEDTEVDRALDAFKSTGKHELTEIRSLSNPPLLVKVTMQAVCALLGKGDEWTAAVKLLSDTKFVEQVSLAAVAYRCCMESQRSGALLRPDANGLAAVAKVRQG